MPLLKTDTLLLPVLNITIEEMSHYLLEQLTSDKNLLGSTKDTQF